MADKTIWGIHMALEHDVRPKAEGYVAIGWSAVGNLAKLSPSREAFKEAYRLSYPDAKSGSIAVSVGVLYRFAVEIQKGDIVVYPCKADRTINIGVVDGPYRYDPAAPEDCPNLRSIKWIKSLPREDFSQSVLNETGAFITLFEVKNSNEEILAKMSGEIFESSDSEEEAAVQQAAFQAEISAEDFILKRLKSAQTHYQFEHFVAHLLRCMGYYARVTKASGDGGIDIVAHRDELGFEPPIIKVQCKQVTSAIGRPDLQRLHGAIETGEHGLFVTLGGYSNEARDYERMKPNLRLIDGTSLVELIYTHYHKFEPQYQLLIPLKRAFVPGPAVQAARD